MRRFGNEGPTAKPADAMKLQRLDDQCPPVAVVDLDNEDRLSKRKGNGARQPSGQTGALLSVVRPRPRFVFGCPPAHGYAACLRECAKRPDRKSTRLNSSH